VDITTPLINDNNYIYHLKEEGLIDTRTQVPLIIVIHLLEDSASDGHAGGEWALVVNIGSVNGVLRGLEP